MPVKSDVWAALVGRAAVHPTAQEERGLVSELPVQGEARPAHLTSWRLCFHLNIEIKIP